ncbi:DUF1573 domain-containing protein [Flavobacteriaceae bacterium XHP0103]|uniref:DUF1573 domain-containing protein n=1 Tax=Marixanthotalea marina TaxID=2844359 RepID=UPI002989B07C|nr:DUF1573 domain-containing protein [Marixanthotalea marina]MBU3822702.1 DUF1573 domain-containing protein [Marixanthotalea marina]
MRKIILGLSALSVLAFTSCKEDASKKINEANVAVAAERDASANKFPVLQFEETLHDFGEIAANTPVETVFNYTNVGDAPLVITDIKSSCGCTVPEDWSREPLAKGESGHFTVKFNGSGSNTVSKTITVTANTEKGTETVQIKAFVKPAAGTTTNSPLMTTGQTQVKYSTQPGHEGHNHD